MEGMQANNRIMSIHMEGEILQIYKKINYNFKSEI
jgi:hypothetical protein